MSYDSSPSALSLIGERFGAALRVVAGRRRRVPIGDCVEALYDADPFAIEVADKRGRLAEIISKCMAAGVLEASKARDRGQPRAAVCRGASPTWTRRPLIMVATGRGARSWVGPPSFA